MGIDMAEVNTQDWTMKIEVDTEMVQEIIDSFQEELDYLRFVWGEIPISSLKTIEEKYISIGKSIPEEFKK